MLADLASQGIEPERPPYRIREDGGRICFVRDPDGYRIEIVERMPEGVIDQPGTGQGAT
jgi:lactoylglutathione lyase